MDTYLNAIHSVASFMELEGSSDRKRFESFAAGQIRMHPAFVALEWLPHVTDTERPAYETYLSKQEGRPARITFGSAINPQPAPEKSDYYPITFLFPRTAAANVIGFNGYSQKELKAALDQSRDSGEAVSASKFRLVERTFDGFAVPVYVPVYRGLGASPSVESRRKALAGFVLGIVDLNTTLGEAIRQIRSADANIQFYDLSTSPARDFCISTARPMNPRRFNPLPKTMRLRHHRLNSSNSFRLPRANGPSSARPPRTT